MLQHRMIWCGFVDTIFGRSCVSWWRRISKVHRSMKNESKVIDELYIKRGCLVLEVLQFFSLYLFSWIAKHVMTLKQLGLLTCLDLNFELLCLVLISHNCYQYHLRLTPPVTAIMHSHLLTPPRIFSAPLMGKHSSISISTPLPGLAHFNFNLH